MARIILGNICKRKDGGSRYLKVNLNPKVATSVTLKSGDYINIETFEEQLASAESAVAEGKISAETLQKIQERIEKDRGYGATAQAVITRAD